MKKTRLIGILGLGLAATLAAQDGSNRPAQTAIVAGNNEFALKLYGQLRTENGNLFFAPLSVRTALAMTLAGARGETAAEMAEVLCLSGDDVHPAVGQLARSVQVGDVEGGCVLRTANSLWAQLGEPFLEGFLRTCEASYGAGLGRVDFRGATEAARQKINAWVAEATGQRIPELLKDGIVDSSTVLVLANAIDFEGTWAHRFDPKNTRPRPFWTPATDGEAVSVEVPSMQTRDRYGYYENDQLQVLEMPYSGESLSMVVVLPRAREGLAALESGLDRARLDGWLAGLKTRELVVQLPRFANRTAVRLDRILMALGMKRAFCSDADFSGMNGKRDLFIGAVVHEAFVNVHEEGTEASGATAVVMKRGAPPLRFLADRPFVFFIRDLRSGAILFFGRVVDPRS